MKKKIVKLVGFLFNLFNIIMFFSMKPCWSGISKTLGYTNDGNRLIYMFPVYLCVLLFCLALINLSCILFKKKDKVWPWVFLGTGVVFFAAMMVIIKLGAADYMRFVWPTFFDVLLACDILGILAFLLFVYPKTKLKDSKAFKCILLAVCIAGSCLYLTEFELNGFDVEPVVYAVEDEYQIVYSTKADSIAWVTINGVDYYDLYSGSMRDGYIHKICVPMEVLNEAGAYQVHAEKVIYRGPFGSFFGKEIQMENAFFAPNFKDGIQYLCVSDVHMNKEAAIESLDKASKVSSSDQLDENRESYIDFYVSVGDLVSDVETFEDANYANEVFREVTKGQVPVIYCRGNHEVKGEYGDDLYRFVGSKDEKFYYTVKMDSVYVLVTDIGEDHDDFWWEFCGTAQFDEYRAEQLEFLQEELYSREFENYEYRLHVCHIPTVYVNYRKDHVQIKADMTALLNQFDLDMSVCGHQHEILIFEPGAVASNPNEKLTYNPDFKKGTYNGYLTDFNFPCLMVSKPGYTQASSDEDKSSHIILHVEVWADGTQQCVYVNSNGDAVNVVNPYAKISYGSCIWIDPFGRFEK